MTTVSLDHYLRLLQRLAREWAADIRPLALELDRDPAAVFRHLDLPLIACMAMSQIPPEHNPSPMILGGRAFYGLSALERVVLGEEIACGDVGMLLASPGASMAGVLVAMLGDKQQQEWFYGRLRERFTWTFFALTEPTHGSDAGGVQSTLTPAPDEGTLLLNGTKKFIGNAARAQLGVVFARTAPGPLGISAVLVETSAPGFSAERIDTIGLRGAELTTVALADVGIAADRVLGRHLSPTRRGMLGWIQTLNLLRPSAAALGVGIARAAHEYVRAHRRTLRAHEREALDTMGQRINGVRQLVRRAAVEVDKNPAEGRFAAAAKVQAARLAHDVTVQALGFFGPGARLTHPLLDKFARDALGIEFIEGTSNIQKLSVFQGLLRHSPHDE
jgi:acyl-CoA dehydrogenase